MKQNGNLINVLHKGNIITYNVYICLGSWVEKSDA